MFVAQACMTDAEWSVYKAWRDRRYRDSESGWATYGMTVVLALVCTSLSVAVELVRPRDGASLAALFMAALIAGMWLPYLTRWWFYRRSRATQRARYPALYDFRFELSDAGVRTTRRGADTQYGWDIFTEAIVTDGLLLLRQTDWDATPIPLRGFATPDEAAGAVGFSIKSIARVGVQAAEAV